MAKRLGPDRPETADALNNLAFLFQKTGDYAKAEPHYREAFGIRQKVLGPEHSADGNIALVFGPGG